MRVGDVSVQVKVPPQRKRPSLVKHAAGVQEAASGSDSRRLVLLSRILIRNEDATSLIRLSHAQGNAVVLADTVRESWD